MAVIQKTLFAENLDKYNTFVVDTDPFSKYFKITELADTFTGGKNAFLIQGSNQLVSDTLIKIEIKDSQGNTIYYEPGEGIISSSVAGEQIVTEYYEGVSKVVAVHIYPDTTFGPCTITILGELSEYYNEAGTLIPVPDNWQGTYNVKWQKQINVNPKLPNTTKIRFYKRPTATITETLSPIYTIVSGSKVESNIVSSFANVTLSKLDTFAGDVKRIKVYRTSEGDISDYDMIQDILVESKELLTSYELTGSVVGEAGLMTSEVLEKLWNYPTLTTELTSSRIDNGVKLNGSGYFTFTSSLNLSENSVYEFGIDAFYSASTPSNMGIYVSGSNNGEVLVGTLLGIEPTKNLNDSLFQFTLPLAEPTASLYLSQSQSEWHIGNLSLKLTQDTAFSPSEIGFTTSMPTVIGNETYNFKFEFYDVNNNYVPVEVTSSALFTGGNNNIGGTLIFISSSASASYDALQKVSSSISGTAALYSSSADTTITTLSGSVDTTIITLSGSVSGSITTLSGSVSSSLTSLSASVSASNALVLSSSFAQVKNLANGQFSGSFIGDTVIYSPAIGGQQGYIKELFTVGDNTASTINLDARTSTRKIYIGTGTYNNTNTGVYLDSGGNFSLKDKLTFDGTTLSVNGTINVTAGNAATNTNLSSSLSNTITSGSIAAANAATSASISASNAQIAALAYASSSVNALAAGNWIGGGTTFISANSIYSPVIQANAGYIAGIFKVGSGGITLDGTNKKIHIGTGTYANTNTGFYVDNDGKFSLKDKLTWDGASTLTVDGVIHATGGTFSGNIVASGTISGGTITGGTLTGGTVTGGTINVPNATAPLFSVNSNGIMTATDANISGQITATSGLLGNWVVDPPASGGSLKDASSRIVLNPTDKTISLYNATNELKARINASDTLTSIGGSDVFAYSIGTSISAPAGVSSNPNSQTDVEGTYSVGTAESFTISAVGTYSISGMTFIPDISLASKVAGLGSVSVSTGSPWGQITPSYPGAGYSSYASARRAMQYVYVELLNSSDAVISRQQIMFASAQGTATLSNYYTSNGTGIYDWVGVGGYTSTASSYFTKTNVPFSFNYQFTSTGTYKLRYSTVMKNQSGVANYLDGSSYTPSYTYYTHSTSGVAVSGLDGSLTVVAPSNFIEMSGGGFQAVTNSNSYVKIFRADSGGGYTQTLLQVNGGRTVLSQADSTDDALAVVGTTRLYGPTNLGYDWSGQYDYYGRAYPSFKSSPVFTRYYASSGGSNTNPTFIDPRRGSFYALSPGSTTANWHWALPHDQFNSLTTVPYAARTKEYSTDIHNWGESDTEAGHMVILFNTDAGRNCYIEGVSGEADNTGWYTLLPGDCVIFIYIADIALYSNGTSKTTQSGGGWVITGHNNNINSW